MTDRLRFVRVFLSSPGDVADERGIARKVIEEAAGQAPFRDQLMVRTVAWDNLSSRPTMPPSSLAAGAKPTSLSAKSARAGL
jgi:hypothetical protein